MNLPCEHPAESLGGCLDRALRRIVAEIREGLRHGHFKYTLTCDVIGAGRRRLILRAGKHYQFVIPGEECAPADRPKSPGDRHLLDAFASRDPDTHPLGGSANNSNDS
jgi:hypothetical protein